MASFSLSPFTPFPLKILFQAHVCVYLFIYSCLIPIIGTEAPQNQGVFVAVSPVTRTMPGIE